MLNSNFLIVDPISLVVEQFIDSDFREAFQMLSKGQGIVAPPPPLWPTQAHPPYRCLESTHSGKQDMPTVDTRVDTKLTHRDRKKSRNGHT